MFIQILKKYLYILKHTKNFTLQKVFNILSEILFKNARLFYDKYNLLEDAEIKIYSQNGEDGILDYIITKLNIKKPNFVEIGVGDYSEANTRYIYEKYKSEGLIIDINKNLKKKVDSKINIWMGNLKILEQNVSPENIVQILEQNASFNIDIFSIDIDGIDYWVIKKLKPKISKIFVLEFNAVFGPNLEVTTPNIKNFDRTKFHFSNLYFGASLKAYINLMREKGFYFLGVNRLRNNAFFINENFSKEDYFKNLKILSLEECTNANFSESRDKNGNLTFLSKDKKIDLIKNSEVINLENNKNILSKIKDLI